MPYANAEDRRTYNRKRRSLARSLGLCINCGDRAVIGSHCQRCRDRHNALRRKGP